jgi:small multidrug resistance pump
MFYNIVLIVAVLFNVAAQFLLKVGMKKISLHGNYLTFGKEMFLNYFFWISLVCYGIGFIFYATVLSKMDLSKAYPISCIIAVILTVLVSVIFINETLTTSKLIGVILCIVGVFIIFK